MARKPAAAGLIRWQSIARKTDSIARKTNYDLKTGSFEQVGKLLAELKECGRSRDLKAAKDLHRRAVENKQILNQFVCNSLISMFAKCGSMAEARNIFDGMCRQSLDVISWNSLLQGYVDNGESELALKLFDDKMRKECSPDSRTYVAVLSACASLARNSGRSSTERLLQKAEAIHRQAVMTCCCNVYVENTLISFFAHCGRMLQARGVFDRMKMRGVVTWNALLRGYVDNGESELALEIFNGMEEEQGCSPDARTYVAALTACAALGSRSSGIDRRRWLEKGRSIHSRAALNRCCDKFVESMLVDMYSKCGCVEDARIVFDRIVGRDIVCWNALLQGYVANGDFQLALEMFQSLGDDSRGGSCRPDSRTYGVAIAACASLATGERKWLEQGKAIHSLAIKNKCCDLLVESALIDMFSKCGKMIEARSVFDKMVNRRDIVCWTALLQGYVDAGDFELALELFDGMEVAADGRAYVLALAACAGLAIKDRSSRMKLLEKGREMHSRAVIGRCCDVFVNNSLISAFTKCGSMGEARRVFDKMAQRNVISWNCIIQGFVDNGDDQAALELVSAMNSSGVAMNSATFVAAITACANLMALESGRAIHEEIRRCDLQQDLSVATCLVDFYGKCGRMAAAKQVFDSICVKDLWAWNTLLAGYSQKGDTVQAFALFDQMQKQGIAPNEITFTQLLTACSHAGMTDRGCEIFDSMSSKHGLLPDLLHYACVIDLLARSNRLDEALKLLRSMPFQANAVIWRSVLGACRKWKNVCVGEIAFQELVRLDERDSAAYVLMSSIYGSVGITLKQSQLRFTTPPSSIAQELHVLGG